MKNTLLPTMIIFSFRIILLASTNDCKHNLLLITVSNRKCFFFPYSKVVWSIKCLLRAVPFLKKTSHPVMGRTKECRQGSRYVLFTLYVFFFLLYRPIKKYLHLETALFPARPVHWHNSRQLQTGEKAAPASFLHSWKVPPSLQICLLLILKRKQIYIWLCKFL